jgi:pilus assembly protein FimV
MMKSTLKLTLAIALCLGSSQALALQLGQIRVKSALDEPLVAEIPLQLDNLVEARNLNVGLASEADFTRAGLSRAGLDKLRFSVVTDTTGHKLILVTSQSAITDPYLDFLVQVDTAKGKQLREYTVLLDPVIAGPAPQMTSTPIANAAQPSAAPAPASPPAPAPAAAPPTSVSTAPAQQTRHATTTAPASIPAPAAPTPAAAVPAQPRSDQYQVNKGDTLYHIATETRPDAQVSIDQMMLALQKANPDAFYHDNINALKSGAILRIPTRDTVSATHVADARAQVRRQMEDWSGAAARRATTVVQNNPVPGVPSQTNHAQATTGSDRLALVPPSQGGGSAASRPGEKGGTGTAEIAGLKQQLATTKESLASLKQENGDLQSRVKDLEDIGGKNTKLLGMKDAEIAELQRKLAEAQQQAAKTAAVPTGNAAPAKASSAAGAPKSAASVATAAPASSSTATSASTVAAHAASIAPAAAKPAPAAKPAMTAAPQNLQNQGMAEPWYRQPLAWIIAGVVILGLILLGLVRRRPKPLPEPEDETPPLGDHFGAAVMPAVAAESHDEPDYQEPVHVDEVAEPADEPEQPAPIAASPAAEDEYGFSFDELPAQAPVAEPGMAAPQPPVAGSNDITHVQSMAEFEDIGSEPADHSGLPAGHDDDDTREHPVPAFSDDPVDTKLDLARAYLDMGDPEGARAMLEEVLNEGSQMQKDEAKKLLEGVA